MPTGRIPGREVGDSAYEEAIRFLYGLRLFGAKFGLENSRRLAALAGDPQRRLRFLHVAGTNGKGSTCAMLESMHRMAGRRVGLFTSPHLISFRERLQVNRVWISEAEVARLVRDLQAWCETFPRDHHPTFFEVVTVMALRWFEEQACDVVVWETGLGGRLDATNIVTPLASVITNIQLDHEKWLGHSLPEIAREKAGIIKPGIPVLTATTEPSALAVIEAVARDQQAPFVCVGVGDLGPPIDALPETFPLLGEHQRSNARLALATVARLQAQLPVSIDAIRHGLETVSWPGRLQVIRRTTGQTILLDGAHNPAGADVLRAALAQLYPGVRPVLVLGILADKDWRRMCQVLAPCSDRIFSVGVSSERTASPEELAEACLDANPSAQVVACHSLADALQLCANDPVVLIAGSLYLIGEALERLQAPDSCIVHERGLNEWGASPPRG